MANETLKKMQEIETAAEEVLIGYRTQAQELRQQVDENLRQLGLTYDDETQKLAEELTASSQVAKFRPRAIVLRNRERFGGIQRAFLKRREIYCAL